MRFKQSQSKPEKCFRGFNGIRTHGLCVSFISFQFICISLVCLQLTHSVIFQSFHVYSEFNKLACSQRMVWVFIAQFVGHCSTNAEAMGSNPVEALKTFFGLTLRLLKSQLQLRWSHLHFIRMSAVHIMFI